MITCVLATKIGDSILRDKQNNIILIHADLFYERNITGYWMLKRVGHNWQILRFLRAE